MQSLKPADVEVTLKLRPGLAALFAAWAEKGGITVAEEIRNQLESQTYNDIEDIGATF
jgi:hypothetical protein